MSGQKRTKKPTPEAAYMMALVIAQKFQVRRAVEQQQGAASQLEREECHLAALEEGLRVVKRDARKAITRAAMPWLIGEKP